MKRTFISISIFCLLLIVLGQTQVWSQDNKSEDKAKSVSEAKAPDSKVTVYIYRYKQFAGWALEPSVYCDEKELAKMDNGRFFKVILDPGKHTFQSNDKQSGIELDLKIGEEYFIRVEIVTGFWKGHGRLVLVSKEQGGFEIKKLQQLDKKKVKDKSKVVIDEEPVK